jgi:NADPH-dependent F420 reductase
VGDQWLMTIAVLGGTGKEGSGLALRWANHGYRVLIGSRTPEKAIAKAQELNEELGKEVAEGYGNAEAAAKADIVVLSVPYNAARPTLEAVKDVVHGKTFIDVTVPLAPPNVRTVHLPEGNAAALEAQAFLGDGVNVVAAFQNISFIQIKNLDNEVDCDVLICGDNDEAKADAVRLAQAAGMRGIDAGPLANAVAVEALTPVLLYINKKYGIKSSGIRITGVDV